ncbi:MAG: hypothetical protein AAGC55_12470, partial [Myxococcota bacterium]
GVIRRGDDRVLTITGALARIARRRIPSLTAMTVVRRSWRRLAAPYHLLCARHQAVIADGFATLNYAHHHLVQYLAWCHWRRDSRLTARAYAPELAEQTGHIVRALNLDTNANDGVLAGTTLRKRILWMSEYIGSPVRSWRPRRVRRLALATLAAAGLSLAALGAKQAIDYHQTYIDRLEQERQRLLDQSTERADRTGQPPAPVSAEERRPDYGQNE